MKSNFLPIVVAIIFLGLSILLVKVDRKKKLSLMEEQRKKGIEPVKNNGRLYILLLALALAYCALKLWSYFY